MNEETDHDMERWLTEIEIREGMARTLWVLAWADYEESQGATQTRRSSPTGAQ